MLFIGADHRGFTAKNEIIEFLKKNQFKYEDIGALKYDKEDDYPDYAFKLAKKVAEDPSNRGILICGSGIGVTIASNKVFGIRAGYCKTQWQAKSAREDDNINILTLDAESFNIKNDFLVIATFLNTEFSMLERHKRRLQKILEYEKNNN